MKKMKKKEVKKFENLSHISKDKGIKEFSSDSPNSNNLILPSRKEIEKEFSSGIPRTIKAIVTVNRISYATRDIEVEIPNAKAIRTSKKLMRKILEERALELAGNFVFDEHDAEYEVENIKITDKKGKK